MPLDLLVPGLLPGADAPAALREARLPLAERWLAAARLENVPIGDPIEWLAREFALPSPAPVAAIALSGEGLEAAGTWMRADPVHLRIDREALRLHGPASLAIEKREADALVAMLQAHFERDGLSFTAPVPERWYVRLPAGEAPLGTPLSSVIGRSVHGHLPQSRGDMNWGRTLTEAQMLLGMHEVNVARESQARPAINSLWFWGGGEWPSNTGAAPYAAIHAEDVFARGLAALSNARLAAEPAKAGDLGGEAGSVLAVIGTLQRALERLDVEAWLAAAARLEADWFAELDDTTRRFGSVRLVLPGGARTLVARLERPSLLQRLRKPKAIGAYG
jgi:hypothetical protein